MLKLGAAMLAAPIAAPVLLQIQSAAAASGLAQTETPPTPTAAPVVTAPLTTTTATTATVVTTSSVAAPAVVTSTLPAGSVAGRAGLVKTRRPFARAIINNGAVRATPGTQATLVRNLAINEIIPLLGQVESDDSPSRYNKIWYKTTDGYVHSSLVQPAENVLNKPVDSVGAGLWGEVTVPNVEMRRAADPDAGRFYIAHFGCVFRITDLREGADQKPWYRLSDGANNNLFASADAFRPLNAAEFAPISPDVPLTAKRIEVDLKNQITTAYESDKPVFTARVATGVGGYYTTPGQHTIFEKRPSRRMVGGAAANYYDLPGISWVSYFTRSRIAFHSTYWHNDYGAPRSHGCVNMLPEDAQWVYRWTLPNAFDEAAVFTSARAEGSLVHVF